MDGSTWRYPLETHTISTTLRESRAEPEANKATENKNRDQRPGIPRDSRVVKQSLDDYATWGRPMVRKALDDVMAEISKSR